MCLAFDSKTILLAGNEEALGQFMETVVSLRVQISKGRRLLRHKVKIIGYLLHPISIWMYS